MKNLCAIVEELAAKDPEGRFCTWVENDKCRAISRGDLVHFVNGLRAWFRSVGLNKGDRVGILSENRWEWIALELATLGEGLVNVALDPIWSPRMMARILAHCGARCVIAETEALATRIEPSGPTSDPELVVCIDGHGPQGNLLEVIHSARSQGSRVERSPAIGPDDHAAIIYTGGSTGEPKGVVRSHMNCLASILDALPWRRIEASQHVEVVLVSSSFCHSAARFRIHLTLLGGHTIALPSRARQVSLRDLELLSPTQLGGMPRLLLALQKVLMPFVEPLWTELESNRLTSEEEAQHRNEFSAIVKEKLGKRCESILWGGAPLSNTIHRFFERYGGIDLISVYASTEIGIGTVQDRQPRVLGSAGRPVNCEMRIEQGEIVVRGPSVTSGYFGNDALTQRCLTKDGWWRTGDLGRFDADGNLFIIGRATALFTCHEGTNIDPVNLEQTLEADTYIDQAILVGSGRPFLAAIIVVDQAAIPATVSNVTEFIESRVALINERLESFEKIRKIDVRFERFPQAVRSLTAANKIRTDREEVGRMFEDVIARFYKS